MSGSSWPTCGTLAARKIQPVDEKCRDKVQGLYRLLEPFLDFSGQTGRRRRHEEQENVRRLVETGVRARGSYFRNDWEAGVGMSGHSVQLFAGFVSSTIFISSNFPMLFRAFKTKDMHSYSMGQLILGNLGNTVYWLYVASLPLGPIWILQGFFSLSSASMLYCYLRYEKRWFHAKQRGPRPTERNQGGSESADSAVQ